MPLKNYLSQIIKFHDEIKSSIFREGSWIGVWLHRSSYNRIQNLPIDGKPAINDINEGTSRSASKRRCSTPLIEDVTLLATENFGEIHVWHYPISSSCKYHERIHGRMALF
jgi:hypothetical protein